MHTSILKGTASLLAIGTELTTGQILNRNSTWISEKLVNLGVEVVLHETVPDDHQLILQALDRCAHQSQFIFITGGLGPTTDDFTRDVIAAWLNEPLIFDETAWQNIVQRLTSFGVPVAESNRKQAYFPKPAQIMPNPQGTAAGFTIRLQNTEQQIWVFPGPPVELKAIWELGVESMILSQLPNHPPLELLTWQCLGKSEAELGEITEAALEGSQLKTGYRAHRPFVEIKVWCPKSLIIEKQPWISKLEEKIQPWIFTRQGEDLGERLLQQLVRSESVEIIDAATGGLLTQRIGTLLRDPENKNIPNLHSLRESVTLINEWKQPHDPVEWINQALYHTDDETILLILSGFTEDGKGAIGFREGSKRLCEPLLTPYRKPELLERMRYFAIEIALKRWSEWLEITTH